MQTEKAKSSHFDRTRGFKNQIFPTLRPVQVLRSYCPNMYNAAAVYTFMHLRNSRIARYLTILGREPV